MPERSRRPSASSRSWPGARRFRTPSEHAAGPGCTAACGESEASTASRGPWPACKAGEKLVWFDPARYPERAPRPRTANIWSRVPRSIGPPRQWPAGWARSAETNLGPSADCVQPTRTFSTRLVTSRSGIRRATCLYPDYPRAGHWGDTANSSRHCTGTSPHAGHATSKERPGRSVRSDRSD